ncbi:hypothetical protein BC833DRAFT_594107 [Globomyces pollinis-pini]|nr:hypothetical protein BC833DRAFT_594107 [Globomyces pollinis-pini]
MNILTLYAIHTQFYTVLSHVLVHSQWLHSDRCSGPPNSVCSFSISDLEGYEPEPNEIWPESFQLNAMDAFYYQCGVAPPQFSINCCVKSLTPNRSGNYKSSAPALMSSTNPLIFGYLPLEANNTKYCLLHSNSVHSNLPYQDILILANDECTESMICSSTGLLTVYNDKSCINSNFSIQLSKLPTTIYNSVFTSVSLSFIKTTEGTITYPWISEVPQSLYIPNTFTVSDITIGFLCALSIVSVLSCFYQLYFKRKQNLFRYFIILNLSWLITVISRVSYIYYIGDDYLIHFGVSSIFENVSTMGTIILTINILVDLRLEGSRKTMKISLALIITVLHFLLAGSRYFSLCFDSHNNCIMSYNDLSIWYSWAPYWTLIFFLVNLMPLLVIVFRFKHTKKHYLRFLFKQDSYFVILLFIQISGIILFYLMSFLQNYTLILGSDRIYTLSVCIRYFIIFSHNAIHLTLLEKFGKLIPKLRKIKKVPKQHNSTIQC